MRAQIIPVQFKEDVDRVEKAAMEDNHYPIAPTHMMIKDGEITGYASVCSIPVMYLWAHSKLTKAPDSIRALKAMEDVVRERGYRLAVIPVSSDSPFHPIMGRLGYSKLFDNTLFGRVL